jgi:hypothetical protein
MFKNADTNNNSIARIHRLVFFAIQSEQRKGEFFVKWKHYSVIWRARIANAEGT